jgi:prevent-host-death family protein
MDYFGISWRSFMQTINIHAAKTHLSRLLDAAAAGEEILIARAGRPVARLMPLRGAAVPQRRQLGRLVGQLTVPDDFDAPLPPDILNGFEGR